jgi:release factor H-coupled RctB family protein
MDNFLKKAPPRAASQAATRLVATPEVWMEGEAVRQLDQVATAADCEMAVGMPDLHPGPGIPIGAAFGFRSTVHPRLVGSDAGCGALVVGLGKVKLTSALERRVRAEFQSPPLEEVDTEALCEAVWKKGPMGLVDFALGDVVDAVAEGLDADGHCESGELISPVFGSALGTIGGGNHFAEIGRVAKVVDRPAAEALGLRQGSLVLLCHSGSRGLGKALADKWGHAELQAREAAPYLAELAGAVRYARANRILLAARLLRALGVARCSKIACAFDSVHNCVQRECCGQSELWVHRKGCAPAHEGQFAAVLGSRGTSSWIMRGRGNSAGLSSVAHGAGRKMKRSEAREKIRARYRRKQLKQTRLGGLVICDDNKLLYEEHPDAYKDIEPVIASLEKAELADRVVSLEPLITVKK